MTAKTKQGALEQLAALGQAVHEAERLANVALAERVAGATALAAPARRHTRPSTDADGRAPARRRAHRRDATRRERQPDHAAHDPAGRMSKYTNDSRWKRVRNRKLREQPDCERCGKPATDVHHVDGLGLAGPEGYKIENTESLCHSCHSRHTNATTYGGFRTPPRRRPREQHPGLIDPPKAA